MNAKAAAAWFHEQVIDVEVPHHAPFPKIIFTKLKSCTSFLLLVFPLYYNKIFIGHI